MYILHVAKLFLHFSPRKDKPFNIVRSSINIATCTFIRECCEMLKIVQLSPPPSLLNFISACTCTLDV